VFSGKSQIFPSSATTPGDANPDGQVGQSALMSGATVRDSRRVGEEFGGGH